MSGPEHASSASRKGVVLYGDGMRADVMHAIRQVLPLIRERADVVGVCTDVQLDLSRVDFDLLMNFGGDGSILGVARAMAENQNPVVGINFGKVGFLATFELPGLLTALPELLEDRESEVLTRRRSIMLSAEIHRRNGEVVKHLALNDIVVSRGVMSRLIVLDCHIDGEYVTHYRSDGLIIASPAGSTAHSLSAGGPLLEPEMEAMIIAPVCPHTMSVRPLVVSSKRHVAIRVVEAPEDVDIGVTFDGQSFVPLEQGDRLLVTQFSKRFVLVTPSRRGFYSNLRAKMSWGGQLERFQEALSRYHQTR